MPIAVTVTREGLTEDLLLWRAYGRDGNTGSMLARTLDRNPGLAGLGPDLPLLTKLTLPDLDTTPEASSAVSLFGD